MIAERHFKNEDDIKTMIVNGHRRGVCDRNGSSVRVNINGRKGFIAKPRQYSSAAKTYVYREGKMVLKKEIL